jgi:hypothetical protein
MAKYEMSVICPCCKWSIPIGGEAVGCFFLKRRVTHATTPCDKWEKFETMTKTRKAIKEWHDKHGDEKISMVKLITKTQREIQAAKAMEVYL